MRIFIASVVLATIALGSGCVVRAYKIPTAAMSPAIKPGDGAIGDELSYKLGAAVERFDIVVFKAPKGHPLGSTDKGDAEFVFRIIAVGGEKVEVRQGKVFINDKELNEPFEKIEGGPDFPPFVVPANEYFLLGDNRPDSWDSRYWRPATIKREDIHGKVVEILPGYYKEN